MRDIDRVGLLTVSPPRKAPSESQLNTIHEYTSVTIQSLVVLNLDYCKTIQLQITRLPAGGTSSIKWTFEWISSGAIRTTAFSLLYGVDDGQKWLIRLDVAQILQVCDNKEEGVISKSERHNNDATE